MPGFVKFISTSLMTNQMYDENTGTVTTIADHKDMRQNAYSGHDLYDCSSFNVPLHACLAGATHSSYRQQSAAGVVLLACCFHGSRATATRLHGGGYISISKPRSLVRKLHNCNRRRGSRKIELKDFCVTGLVLIWHRERGKMFTKKAFTSYIKRFILKLQ